MEALQHIFIVSQRVLRENRHPSQEELNSIRNATDQLFGDAPMISETHPLVFHPDKSLLDRFFDFMHKHHCDASVSVEQICRELGVSRAKLNRRIKVLTGEAVMEHLRRLRLSMAAARLATDKDSIADIAYDCGFSDPNYFCRAFTKMYACTPTQYRLRQVGLRQKSR